MNNPRSRFGLDFQARPNNDVNAVELENFSQKSSFVTREGLYLFSAFSHTGYNARRKTELVASGRQSASRCSVVYCRADSEFRDS